MPGPGSPGVSEVEAGALGGTATDANLVGNLLHEPSARTAHGRTASRRVLPSVILLNVPIDTAGGACTIQVGTYFHIRNGSGAKC